MAHAPKLSHSTAGCEVFCTRAEIAPDSHCRTNIFEFHVEKKIIFPLHWNRRSLSTSSRQISTRSKPVECAASRALSKGSWTTVGASVCCADILGLARSSLGHPILAKRVPWHVVMQGTPRQSLPTWGVAFKLHGTKIRQDANIIARMTRALSPAWCRQGSHICPQGHGQLTYKVPQATDWGCKLLSLPTHHSLRIHKHDSLRAHRGYVRTPQWHDCFHSKLEGR